MTKQEVLHLNETDNRKEVKRKFALWIKQSTIDMVEGIYKEDNCSSRSEFIEKAIIFMLVTFPQMTTVNIFPMWLPLH